MAGRALQDAPEVQVDSLQQLRDWLTVNHGRGSGIWLVTFKQADPDRHVAYKDIVDEALCFGWVDSLPRAKDADRTMLYLSPRKAGSNWSRVNKAKVDRLEAEGRMAEPGRRVVARAKADGTWTALDDVENLILPPDLAAAFDTRPDLLSVWEGWPRSVKRGALEILLNARRSATRSARIATILESAERGERPFQWRKT